MNIILLTLAVSLVLSLLLGLLLGFFKKIFYVEPDKTAAVPAVIPAVTDLQQQLLQEMHP